MKIEIKAVNLGLINDTNLLGYINNLSILQANGVNPIDKNRKPGTLSFPGIGDIDIPFDLVKNYVNNPLVDISEYPLYLKMSNSQIDSLKVFEGLPLRYYDDTIEDEIELNSENNIKVFSEWKVDSSTTQPIYNSNGIAIISCQAIGRKLYNNEISSLIIGADLNNLEILDLKTYKTFINEN